MTNTAPSGTPVPELLHDFFEYAARRAPEQVAVEIPPGVGRPARVQVTYAELETAANAWARTLRLHVAGECFVAILLPRTTPQLYAAQLAVLKSGAAYTCLDPSFPDERVREILDDSAAVAVLTDAAGAVRIRQSGSGAIAVIDVGAPSAGEVARAPAVRPSPDRLAYLIYTSGTTGRPKGVMIEHRSIANLVASDLATFRLSPADRVAQGSSPAYDSSVEEIWLAWAAGATLVAMDDDAVRAGPDLVPWLQRERITVFCPPPTLLRATGCADPESALPALKLLYVGGEALSRDVADRWSRGREMVNGYGPTECTVTCLRDRVEAGHPITIGRPVPGTTAWVLNDALEEVAVGESGELCLGGIGVARGYWRRPELTAEKFISHPRLGRLYRTGDLVHRDAAGSFFYHGRIDSQVKLRGYRIELGEIEARLAECPGVRAAACSVQDEGGRAALVAFIVPENPSAAPSPDELKSALGRLLPGYMVPSRFGFLSALPTTVGGKLNRAALPRLEDAGAREHGPVVAPRTPLETAIHAAFAASLRGPAPISVHADFFHDLGGDSLGAAELVTALRADPRTAWVTVRDVYEARTIAALAERVPPAEAPVEARRREGPAAVAGRPVLATLVQAAWLLAVATTVAFVVWLIGFVLLPWLAHALGLVPLILLAPALVVLAFVIYTPLALVLGVMVKWVLIGRYLPLRAPVWGGFYVRNWIVQETVRLAPWGALEGTVFQLLALRALGARIGERVHVHRGVDLLSGGWDLLELGDDVTLSQDASVRLVELDEGEIVVGPVTLGRGATLDVRAGAAGHTVLEADAMLAALSSLRSGGRIPAGERWDGVPAQPVGRTPAPPPVDPTRDWSPLAHGLAMLGARGLLTCALALPIEVLTVVVCLGFDLSADNLWHWMTAPATGGTAGVVAMALALVAVPLTVAWMAACARLIGRVPEGTISRWSPAYIRVWVKTGLVHRAGEWLSGTLFWPAWLRAAGMDVGRGCEISTIIDVVPEHVVIGAETFFADGIYLGGPRVQRGTVELARTRLGRNTFLGNHVVVPAGGLWPDDILLGISTATGDHALSGGSSWFGHPPFELPRREVVAMDRRLTHEPSAIRYWNRVYWELLRFALPVVPLVGLVGWAGVLVRGEAVLSRPMFPGVLVPLAAFGVAAFHCGFVLALKWFLLGRVRPGQHALWSCWCSRWDFLYVAWGQLARPALEKLEGTLLLSWYLRAMGMKLGRGVVLGPGFSQVVDPDMIVIGDGATVNAMFQAHTFEDRVLKTDRVIVGRGATLGHATVPLYGAEIGERTHVAPHSVVMKREHLLPGRRYEGAPTRPRVD